MAPLTESQLLRFLIEIAALLIASRVLAEVAKRFDQAPVIGELLAGILLGKSVLGHLSPATYAYLFTADPLAMHLLESIAWLGAIMLLLYIGLETELEILRGLGRAAVSISSLGMAVPFASGIVLGYMLPASYLANPNGRLIFALFMAVAMSISAVPVIAKILLDLGLIKRELGMLILAGGIVDDTTGWLLLSLVAGLATRGTIDAKSVSLLVIEGAAFLAFAYFAGYRLARGLMRWIDDRTFIEHGKFSAMVIVALVCGVATQFIGLHAVFGAFVAGLMIRSSTRVRKEDLDELKAMALGVMAPIFFAYSGLKADPASLGHPMVPLIVLGIACIGKLIGCGAGGLLAKLKPKEALAVAIGMNARGGMEIIVALIGLTLGILTQEMYTIIIMVAIVTSVVAPAALKWSLSKVEFTRGEYERMEREKLLSRLPLSRAGAKLLVLSGGGPHSDLAAHIAAGLTSHHDASITVFRALTPGAKDSTEQFNEQFQRIKAIAEQSGANSILQRTGTAETVSDAIHEETSRGYDAIFAGASQLDGHAALSGEILRELVANAQAPVVIVRDAGAKVPLKRILCPTTGAAFSRLGSAVAMQYTHTFQGRMTTLYVRERSPVSLSSVMPRRQTPNEGEDFVDEIKRLGEELGVSVDSRIDTGRRAENVIVNAASNGNYDLLVMGVLYRSSEQRLYFGPKVRHILRNIACSVALVVPPQPKAFRNSA
ncbi:MAG TPA: cation:proton antiporter [Candidatus Binataceae bacterium]|nr:cation:proton antiporter [Candidatus Binataceae bacterium]